MSGTPRRNRPLWSPSRAPTRSNCKLTLVLTAPVAHLISLSLSRLTDENLGLVPPLPEFFPGVPLTALMHAGFAFEHVRYVSLSHQCLTSNKKNDAQNRTHDPHQHQRDTRKVRRVVCHRYWPLSWRGALAPRGRSPPGHTRCKCGRTRDWLRNAKGW